MYYGWDEDECLLTLSLSVEGPTLRYFHILLSDGKRRTLREIASQFKQRIGKGILQAVSQVQFYDSGSEREPGTVSRPSY